MLRASNVGPVLQQQVLGALKDLFVLCGRLAVFAVADLVDDAAEGGHDMELVKDDLGVGQFFLTALMYGSHMSMTTASIGLSLLGRQLIEEAAQGFGLSIFANINDLAGFVVQHHGQVAVALADGDLIHRQDAKPVEIRLAVVGFQILFVDVLDRFPVQLKVPGDIGDGHHLAQLVDLSGQPPGHPQIGVKELQLLDADSLAMGTEQLAVLASQPDLGAGQVQVPHRALSPAVNVGGLLFPHK